MPRKLASHHLSIPILDNTQKTITPHIQETSIVRNQRFSLMAKFGRLTKLKSAIKNWPSFTKNHHSTTASTVLASDVTKCDDLQVVYVGKSRRPYMLSSHIIAHPLFQELLDRSSRFIEERDDQETVVVACEVVLFEHLLWMLKNSCAGDDDDDHENELVMELAEFYTY